MNSESQTNGLLDLNRGPAIAGTRITVYTVLEYLIRGRSREYIAEVLRVSVEQVQAAINYIAAHDLEMLREYVKILERIRRGNAPEVQAKIEANRPRFEALERAVREAKARGDGPEAVRRLLEQYRQEGTRRNTHAGDHGG